MIKNITNDGSQREDGIISEEGGIIFKLNQTVDSYGSSISEDLSFALWQDKNGNEIRMQPHQILIKSTGDKINWCGGNEFLATARDKQISIAGNLGTYVVGDQVSPSGPADSTARKANEDLQQHTSEIDKEKIKAIEETEGEMIPCPVCSQTMVTDRASNTTNAIMRTVRDRLPNFPFPLDVLQKWMNMLIAPFLSTTTNLSLNGGKGCGSPSCKNGMVPSSQKNIEAGNEKAKQVYDAKQADIAKAQKNARSGGSRVKTDTADVIWKIGATRNDAPSSATVPGVPLPLSFNNAAKPGDPFAIGSKGSSKGSIFSSPLINPGSLVLDVSNKCTILAGSPGMELHTSGKAILTGSFVDVIASKGELNLVSGNRTIIKGKNVIIDADDRSGDQGFLIRSKDTMVQGKLSVSGDLALKGSLMMDGGIHCTHLTVPSERIPSGSGGGAHQVHSNATWNVFGAGEATVFDEYDKAYKKASRDIYNTLSLNILNLSEIKTLVEEAYSSMMTKMPLDNMGIATGITFSHGYAPGTMIYGQGVCSCGGTVVCWLLPGQQMPSHNFTHLHGSPGQNHSHDTTVPAFDGYDTPAASRAVRPNPSHVPTPARPRGMGTAPGHKSLGDITSCGGGGGAFVNAVGSTTDDAILARNRRYGVDSQDAFGGENYVNTTPATGNYKFNPDGTIDPPPDFTAPEC